MREVPLLWVVTPAFNEAENLPHLYERLARALDGLPLQWRWMVVDDHSTDGTFAVLRRLAENDSRVHAMRFSRNFGSHAAIWAGLQHARGDCAVVLSADLQDPPEIVPALIDEWRRGKQVVWAVRGRSEGFSRLYNWLMRRVVGVGELPSSDVCLLDRRVVRALRKYGEKHNSLFLRISWLGFEQGQIRYDRAPRRRGRSGWTLEKKLKLLLDSVTSFTYLPVRLMAYLGAALSCAGFAFALLTLVRALLGLPPQGWASLMIAILVLGGMQMLMLGVLGEYLWRTLDELRAPTRYVVEAEIGTRKPPRPADGPSPIR